MEKALRNIDGEIFVVDNNSSDGSKDFFKDKFPGVEFIWNGENEGFAKANNRALQQVSGSYILFLNPDTIVPEDCFEKCISFIQSKNNDITCGIKMIDGSGNFLKESKRAFPSPMTSFYKLSGLTRLFPKSKLFSKYHLGYLDENKNHEVAVLAGAFMMIPKKIIDTVGGFDESFFMYGEDIDLSYRIQKAGYKNYYFAEISIIHFKGESTKKGSLNYIKMFYKAMLVFVKKHYGGTKAGLYNFFIRVAIFIRAGLSAIARFFTWNRSKRAGVSDKKIQTVVAGTKVDFDEINNLFQTAGINKNIIGRISPHPISEYGTAGTFVEIAIILNSNAFEAIIFCEGQLSFKQIIEAISKVPRQMKIIFFSQNLHALIGSNNKNDSGTVINR